MYSTDNTSCTIRHCNKCDMYRKELQKYKDTGLTPEQIIYKTQPQWISVAERLPAEPPEGLIEMDELKEYVVMIAGAERSTFCTYSGDGEWYRDGTFYRVVAWMPLPEPYKPGN